MVLSKAGATLAAALVLAGLELGAAQSQPPQAPPAQIQTKPQEATPATPQTGPVQPQRRRQGRKKRAPRTSRLPAWPTQGLFEEARMPRDPGPMRQQLTLTANVLGGYDDNLTAGLGTGTGVAPTAMASGATGYMDGTLGYFRGNTLRSIRMDSTGSVTAYPGYLDRPAAGGVVAMDAKTPVGRNLTLRASERVGYEPLFNVISPGASSAPLPPAIGEALPATGLFERRSLNSSSSVSIDRRWSREDATSLSYSYRVEQFTNDDYGDNNAHEVRAQHRRRLATGVRARAEYRYVNLDYTDSEGTVRPTLEHRIEGGPEIEKAVSRRRDLTLSLAGGGGYIETAGSADRLPYHAWVPTGSASAKLALSPLSSVDGGYRRDFSLFRGVTDEVYSTDTAFVSTGGFVTNRTDLRAVATYSHWKTLVASGVSDSFNVYGASLQLRVKLTESVAATAAYYYYHHRYSNPGDLPAGFPAEYDRHAVRVGLAVWVPLAGTPQRPQR
jgi:hypothetical protein